MLQFADKHKLLAAVVGIATVGIAGSSLVGTPSTLSKVFGQHGPLIAVHVAGHVKHPGLYHLDPQARVDDAVTKAGGATDDADVDKLNLAASIEDGTKLDVPGKGQPDSKSESLAPDQPTLTSHTVSAPIASKSWPKTSPSRKGPKAPAGKVSLNKASIEDLQQLPGVGPATAQKIVEYREANGGFKDVDEIQNVKGIGPVKFGKMEPYLAL